MVVDRSPFLAEHYSILEIKQGHRFDAPLTQLAHPGYLNFKSIKADGGFGQIKAPSQNPSSLSASNITTECMGKVKTSLENNMILL